MESNTKTIAKLTRVGPRTQIVSTMKMLFSKRLYFQSDVGSPNNCFRSCIEGLDEADQMSK